MRISLNWLNDYIDLSGYTPENISFHLTDLGLEVEEFTKEEPLPQSIVVGQILEAKPHPQADSLRLCQVDIGQENPLEIVCGASNARAGIKVAVATVGTKMPSGLEIKSAKIRGVDSSGMLCSEEELGLSDASEGIWELEHDKVVGAPVQSILPPPDAYLNLNVTANRGDCLSYFGVARELAARLGKSLKTPTLSYKPSGSINTNDILSLKITESSGCSRFYALYVNNVSPEPSPTWLKKRILSTGMRPINSIVDVTNYVMMETGQPIHAYDACMIKNKVLGVRRAEKDERLKVLDGTTINLENDDILIVDGVEPIGLAGIMGGEHSEVKDETQAIVIEAAAFDAIQIRRTARRLGMNTEASQRFERRINQEQTLFAAQRVADLLYIIGKQKGGGGDKEMPQISSNLVSYAPKSLAFAPILFRLSRLEKIYGAARIGLTECQQIFSALGFAISDAAKENEFMVTPPAWRHDIEKEIDLIEEIIRHHGYEHVPYSLPTMAITPTPEDPFIAFTDEIRKTTSYLGFSETISFPFHKEKTFKAMRIGEGHAFYPTVALLNPLSEDEKFLQTSLLPSLITAICRGQHHGQKGARLFEVGRCYFAASARKTLIAETNAYLDSLKINGRYIYHHEGHADPSERPIEKLMWAGIIDQPYQEKGWRNGEIKADFYTLKSILASVCKFLDIGALKLEAVRGEDFPFLNPKSAATLMSGGTALGYLGELHPELAFNFDFKQKDLPLVFEINVEQIFKAKFNESPSVLTSIPRFPGVTRDFALMVDSEVTHEKIDELIAHFPKKTNLSHWSLFDLYTGSGLPQGKKSMGYRFVFQHLERTLKDSEVDSECEKLLNHLNQSHGIQLRQ